MSGHNPVRHAALALLLTASCAPLPGLAASGATLVTLHSFASDNVDGVNPAVGLTNGPKGALYGVTLFGGHSGGGTVFAITPKGVEKVLYSFGGYPDAGEPTNALVRARDGNFYGNPPTN